VNDRRYSYIKHLLRIVVAVTIAAAMALPTFAQPPLPPEPRDGGDGENPPAAYAPGEILVQFKPTVGALGAQSALAAQGLQATGAIPAIGVLKVKVEPGQELETIAVLERNPNVAYAEPNYIAFAFETVPNDPGYGFQWGLPKINAPAAWDITTGSSDVVIAVVDTGIDLEHPDFNCPGKFVPGYDFYNNDSNPDDDHNYGHGTHVAGIAAACTNNATGVAGVAWGARLMPVKVLSASGGGTYATVAEGITYAADNGADIINLSLGGLDPSTTMANAIQYAVDRGVLVVAAAGNCAQDGYQCNYIYNPIMYPAAYETTFAVAATDSNDAWANFSEHHPYVDVAAPGVSIMSTVPGGYSYLNGTSMATPYVSGLAALIWSLDPSLTHDQVREVIQSSADDLGTPGKDDYFGYGRIDAWQALNSVVSLETSPAQVSFLIDADSGPFPPAAAVQITTDSSEPITWTTSISPSANWLAVLPVSGSVSAAASDSFTLVVPARPSTYGTFDTTAIVTGTTSSGAVVGLATTQVRITYVPEITQFLMPIIYK